jgi:CubicO group peptidase (beta-lactamase class C family)
VTEALGERLKLLTKQHDVPGVSVAILTDDGIDTAVAGVVNRNTKVAVTPDSVFQIGSITTVYTTTLMMQLVDDGLVDLDKPVVRYLPKFALKVPGAEKIKVRHLLTHTSGIEGDYFRDFGRGEDAVQKYVDSLKRIGLAHPTGKFWSYSNAGFVVAGRIIEVVTKLTWDDALRTKLLEPAGLTETVSLPGEAILFRAAAGHMHKPGEKKASVAKPWALPRSTGPAGASPCASARDVVSFAAIHMNEGRASNGSSILSPASVKSMQMAQFKLAATESGAMGLGWVTEEWSGERVIWHNGGTLGQLSFLWVVPDKRVAVCILTNSDTGPALADTLSRELFSERFGIERPGLPVVPEEPVEIDLAKYAGHYKRLGVAVDVEPGDGKLNITMKMKALIGDEEPPPQVFGVTPLDKERFAMVDGQGKVQGVINFQGFDRSGRPEYISVGRLARRVQ